MPSLTIVEAINLALKQEMKRDKRVILLGEDVGKDGGVFRVTDGLYDMFRGRVFDTPIAESAIVGASLGLAAGGMKPIAEIQFEGFIMPAFDQIVNQLARMRNRSRGKITCPVVIRCPIGGGFKGLELHSDSPEAYFAHTPGIKVVIPSTPYDAKGLLISAIRDPNPVIFFEPKRIYRAIKQEVPEKEYTIPIGKANVVQQGTDVTVISYSASMRECREAMGLLNEKYSIELIDLRTVKPIDWETVLTSVKKTGRAVVVHEAQRTCGLGAEIAATIQEEAILSLKAPVIRVTAPDVIVPLPKLEEYYTVNEHHIVDAIERVMNF